MKKIRKTSKGTEVHLKLKKEFVENGNLVFWEQKLVNFLNDTLKKVNCKFKYIGINDKLDLTTGWCFDKFYQNKILLKSVDNIFQNSTEINNLDFFSELKQTKIKNSIALLPKFRQNMEHIQNFITEEGIIPNRKVYYKIIIPYYELESGASFVYFYEKDNEIYPCYNRLCIVPTPTLSYSWKGMKTTASTQSSYSFMYGNGRMPTQKIQVHFDLCEEIDNNNISVSRNHCQLSVDFENELFRFIDEKFDEIVKRETKFNESKYTFINMAITNSSLIVPKDYYWFFPKNSFCFELRQINSFYHSDLEYNFMEHNFKMIALSQEIEIPLILKYPNEIFQTGFFSFLSKFHSVINMRRLISFCQDVKQIPNLIQRRRDYISINQHEPPLVFSFPKGYENIVSIMHYGNGSTIYFNETNELLQDIDLKNYYLLTNAISQRGLNEEIKRHILTSMDFKVCFLLQILFDQRHTNLFKNDSIFLGQVFEGITQKNENCVLIFNQNTISQVKIPKNENEQLSFINDFNSTYPNLFDSFETLTMKNIQLTV